MQVTKRNTPEFEAKKLYVGLEQFKIVAVNPTTEEINKLYERENKDDDKDQVYVDDKDGIDRVRITFFAKGVQTQRIVRTSFYIIDKIRKNKDETKKQYINQVLQSGWGATENDLMDFFTEFQNKEKQVIGKKAYREAKEGECDFYDFVKGVMSGIDYYDPGTDVKFDFKKMLKGNFKELQTWLLDEEYSKPFCAINYIKNVDGEGGEIKTYNEIFSKAILPAEFYGKFEYSTSKFYRETLEQLKADPEEVERLKIPGLLETLTVNDIYGWVNAPTFKPKKSWEEKAWNKFVSEIEGEYGCKGWYKIAPVFEYFPAMDVTANREVLATDSSY